VEINGQPVDDWSDVLQAIYGVEITQEKEKYTAQPLEITWLSPDNQMHTATITPIVSMQNILTPTSMKTGKRYPIRESGSISNPTGKRLALSALWPGGGVK
jgi:hypothetical protein